MIKFELCLEELLYTKSRVRDPAGSEALPGREESRETSRGKGPDVSEMQGAQTTHEARLGVVGSEGCPRRAVATSSPCHLQSQEGQ